MKSFLTLTITLTLIVSAPSITATDQVLPCDEYAAHPNDPNRWAKGVSDEAIIPGPAVKYCTDAVTEFVDTPRFQFQLGRALWAAYRYAEGNQVFASLAEEVEYGPVYAYLGEAHLYGVGDAEVDEELAIELYVAAAESGFIPAIDFINALTEDDADNVGSDTVTVDEPLVNSTVIEEESEDFVEEVARVEPDFDASKFIEPDIMNGLYHGSLDKIQQGNMGYINEDRSLVYMQGFLLPFSENVSFLDHSNSCVDLYRPVLARQVEMRIAKASPGSAVLFGGDLDAAAVQGYQLMGDLLKGMAGGGGMLNAPSLDGIRGIGILKDNGEKDAVRLIKWFGCDSQVVQRVFSNVAAMIDGTSLIRSEQEQQRADKVKAEMALKKEQEKQERLRQAATQGCLTQYKKQLFCDCVVNVLTKEEIAEADWQGLATNFRTITSMRKKFPELGAQIRSCRAR